MKNCVRTFLITLLLALAGLLAAGVLVFQTQHLSIYDSRQAAAKFGVNSRDLALIRPGRPGYVWVLPGGGLVLNGLRRSPALIGLVYVPALLISLYEIRRLGGYRRYEGRQISRSPENSLY